MEGRNDGGGGGAKGGKGWKICWSRAVQCSDGLDIGVWEWSRTRNR